MQYCYRKSFEFFMEHKHMLILSLLVCLINAPMKGTGWSFLGAGVIILLYITGISGLVYRKTKDPDVEVGVKSLVVESGLNFSFTVLTFMETIFIMAVDFMVAISFVLAPLFISGYSNSDKSMGYWIIIVLASLIFIYRLPLFIMSYFTHIVNKESGRFGVIRIKEIIAKKPKIWIHLILQTAVYSVLTALKYSIHQNWIIFTVIDVAAGMIFLYFIVTDLYMYLDVFNSNEDMKERYDRNYKGIYKGILGRFFI